ncbi:hypothetical protein RHGRI_020844 [Rhododendron griersonianum]|uniref:Uncharacterized protein n=1 Tax=Rhododendron griersonianum TaxID=479676 RepID=A0AAV6JHR5_9ERIC|nr:hypothetical protein RHGRI_020844 [Rhododendron griersonianum]
MTVQATAQDPDGPCLLWLRVNCKNRSEVKICSTEPVTDSGRCAVMGPSSPDLLTPIGDFKLPGPTTGVLGQGPSTGGRRERRSTTGGLAGPALWVGDRIASRWFFGGGLLAGPSLPSLGFRRLRLKLAAAALCLVVAAAAILI